MYPTHLARDLWVVNGSQSNYVRFSVTQKICMAPKRQISVRLPDDVLIWLQSRGAETQRSAAFILAGMARAEMAKRSSAKTAENKAGEALTSSSSGHRARMNFPPDPELLRTNSCGAGNS